MYARKSENNVGDMYYVLCTVRYCVHSQVTYPIDGMIHLAGYVQDVCLRKIHPFVDWDRERIKHEIISSSYRTDRGTTDSDCQASPHPPPPPPAAAAAAALLPWRPWSGHISTSRARDIFEVAA
jgi:hypothetical protein